MDRSVGGPIIRLTYIDDQRIGVLLDLLLSFLRRDDLGRRAAFVNHVANDFAMGVVTSLLQNSEARG